MAGRKFKRTYKRKAWKRTKKGMSMAAKALYIARKVAARTKPEVKKRDSNWVAEAVTSAGTVYDLLSDMSQGDAYNQRTGRVIKPTRLSGRILIETPTDVDTVVRLVIFRGINNNGKQYKVGYDQPDAAKIGILDNDNGSGLLPLVSHKNDDTTRLSNFIYDKTYNFSRGTTINKFLKYNFKLKGTCVYSTGPNEDNPDHISTGGLYFMLMSNTDSGILWQGELRVNFTDV